MKRGVSAFRTGDYSLVERLSAGWLVLFAVATAVGCIAVALGWLR